MYSAMKNAAIDLGKRQVATFAGPSSTSAYQYSVFNELGWCSSHHPGGTRFEYAESRGSGDFPDCGFNAPKTPKNVLSLNG